jgi:aminoglycoside phosphotransferase (APT) family kinase protein
MRSETDAARRVIDGAIGRVLDLTEFETWGSTIVVGASLEDGARAVLKASGLQDVHIEAMTMQRAASAGVPVPKVRATGADSRLPGSHWFIMDWLPGSRWNDMDWPESRHHIVLDELALHLARLHELTVDGCGPLDTTGRGTFASWPDYLLASLTPPLTQLVAERALDAGFAHSIVSRLEELERELNRRPSRLLHADLGDGEVYVTANSGEITGIVDWGASIGGDPLYEFARIVAGGPADDPRPARFLPRLMVAYDRQTRGFVAAAPDNLLPAYQLHNGVLNAGWSLNHAPDWIPGLVRSMSEFLTRSRQKD